MSFAPGRGGWLALLCASRMLAASWFVAYSAALALAAVTYVANIGGRASSAVPWLIAGAAPRRSYYGRA